MRPESYSVNSEQPKQKPFEEVNVYEWLREHISWDAGRGFRKGARTLFDADGELRRGKVAAQACGNWDYYEPLTDSEHWLWDLVDAMEQTFCGHEITYPDDISIATRLHEVVLLKGEEATTAYLKEVFKYIIWTESGCTAAYDLLTGIMAPPLTTKEQQEHLTDFLSWMRFYDGYGQFRRERTKGEKDAHIKHGIVALYGAKGKWSMGFNIYLKSSGDDDHRFDLPGGDHLPGGREGVRYKFFMNGGFIYSGLLQEGEDRRLWSSNT